MLATSVGGSVTGKGGDFIIADDLQNPQMADSETERETVIRFFDETLLTRLDNKKNGRMAVIQQRTHQADLTGHLLEQGGWELLCLPAEFEKRTTICFPRSKRELVKEAGDLLWPEREEQPQLDAAKLGLGSYAYAAQYLQNPVARGGNLFKESWLGTFRDPPKFDFVLQSWDCAYKTGQANDYSACATIGVVQNRSVDSSAARELYLLHAWHGKVEFPELERRVKEFYSQRCPHAILVEDTASGQSLLQQLRSNSYLPVKGVKPGGDKYARAATVTSEFERGGFFIREGASWSAEYVAELTAFPGGAHDDFVDATVQALAYLRENLEPGILVYYRERAEGMRRAEREASIRQPGLSAFELARFEQEAGYCHKCKRNLFKLSHMTDGPGYLCKDCWNKKDVSPIASTS
jgi:predicted phage terminase large subunit-like protein